MKNKAASTTLCKPVRNNLSTWDEAVLRAKAQIRELKRAIQTFQEMKARGVAFPEPSSESKSGLLGQKGDLGQSLTTGYLVHSWIPEYQRILGFSLCKSSCKPRFRFRGYLVSKVASTLMVPSIL